MANEFVFVFCVACQRVLQQLPSHKQANKQRRTQTNKQRIKGTDRDRQTDRQIKETNYKQMKQTVNETTTLVKPLFRVRMVIPA
jgi:hypothetical protein